MRKKNILPLIAMSVAVLGQTIGASAASVVNPTSGSVPTKLEIKHWYQVKLPAAIDLEYDEESVSYKDDYEIQVCGEVPDKVLKLETGDIDVTSESGDKLVLENYIGQVPAGEKNHEYVFGEHEGESVLSKDWQSITGITRCDFDGVKTGTYTGTANYKFKLVEPTVKHTHSVAMTVMENEVPATETATGSYDEVEYCDCGKEMSRTKKEIPKLHVHKVVRTEKENEVAATTAKAGSYDEVSYCECGEVISRVKKEIPMIESFTYSGNFSLTPEAQYNANANVLMTGATGTNSWTRGDGKVMTNNPQRYMATVYYVDDEGQFALCSPQEVTVNPTTNQIDIDLSVKTVNGKREGVIAAAGSGSATFIYNNATRSMERFSSIAIELTPIYKSESGKTYTQSSAKQYVDIEYNPIYSLAME